MAGSRDRRALQNPWGTHPPGLHQGSDQVVQRLQEETDSLVVQVRSIHMPIQHCTGGQEALYVLRRAHHGEYEDRPERADLCKHVYQAQQAVQWLELTGFRLVRVLQHRVLGVVFGTP